MPYDGRNFPNPAKKNGYGLDKHRQILRAVTEDAAHQGRDGVVIFGDVGVGKTTLADELPNLAPPGSELLPLNCSDALSQGVLERDLDEISRIVRQTKRRGLWLPYLDEADAAAPERQKGSPRATLTTLKVLGLINQAKECGGALVVLGTNVPSIIDRAVARRCQDAVFVDVPQAEFLKEALVDAGYPHAHEAAQLWVDRMARNGFCRPAPLLDVIRRYTRRIARLGPKELVDHLEPRVRGLRIRDPESYALQYPEWVGLAKETQDRYIKSDQFVDTSKMR